MILTDPHLVETLEEYSVAEMSQFAHLAQELFPGHGVALREVSTGVAVCGGTVIPFSEAVGTGIKGVPTDTHLDLLEAFYDDCAGPVSVAVVSPGVEGYPQRLAQRGWRPDGFEDVLVREIDGSCLIPHGSSVVSRVEEHERSQWAEQVVTGFADGSPSETHMRFARVLAARRELMAFWVLKQDGPAATGELVVSGEWAWLAADTTKPQYRRQGLQEALQRARLDRAAREGCRYAAAEARPGSISHRNYQRLGFAVAYTRLWMSKGVAK